MIVVFIFVFVCEIILINGQIPNSPCPDIFNYERNNWATTGLLKIIPSSPTINIHVKLSVGAEAVNSQGRLQYLQDKTATCDHIQRNGLNFKVHFPTQNPLPYVQQIRLNGKVICVGQKAPSSFVSTFDLYHNLKLSCKPSVSVPPTVSIPRRQPIAIQQTIFGNDEICGEILQITTKPLVINGTISRTNYPWLAQIYFEDQFICGGNLVSNQHILTAAHCITEVGNSRDTKKFNIVLGVHNFSDSLGQQTISSEVKSIHLHPLFESASRNLANDDIAIIIIKKKINNFTNVIKPICLFNSLSDISTLSNTFGKIAGWGKDETDQNSAYLKETAIQIVSKETCLKSNGEFQNLVTNKNFCAGGVNGSGPCNGDSGGGLFLQNENTRKWYLRGIISTSLSRDGNDSSKCDVNNYAIYTDLARYIRWIKEFVV